MLRWFVSHKQWIWARIILALQANRLIIKCAGHFQTFSSRHFVSKFSLFETFDSFNMRNWKFCKNCKCNCVIFINTEYFSYFVSYFFFILCMVELRRKLLHSFWNKIKPWANLIWESKKLDFKTKLSRES